jgi:shikimate kinase
MYRTLSQLRDSINELINEQGENAPVAAFVFTKNDVIYYEDGEDGFPDLDEEKSLSDEYTDDVLLALGGCDYIYEQVNEIIEDEVNRIRKSVSYS